MFRFFNSLRRFFASWVESSAIFWLTARWPILKQNLLNPFNYRQSPRHNPQDSYNFFELPGFPEDSLPTPPSRTRFAELITRNLFSLLTPGGNFMLVLSRQLDEKIIIGDSIVITVVEIRRGLVRLGIDAPRDVPVHREEVYNAIKASEDTSDPPPPEPQKNSNDSDAG